MIRVETAQESPDQASVVPGPGPGDSAISSAPRSAPGRLPLGGLASYRPLTLEDVVCELCGQSPTHYLLTTRDLVWRKPGVFRLMQCPRCGLIMTAPRPTPASMPIYYEDWYTHGTIEQVRDEHAHGLANRYITWVRLKILEQTGPLRPGMKVLDVGAGFGVQLAYYIRRRGVVGTALDVDPTTTANSLVKDIAEVRTGDLLDAGLPADWFDVVTFHETLEHVHRPLATLREAYRVLKPGGRLVVEVPDFGSPLRGFWGRFWFATMVPVHLYHFTRQSLRRLVTAAGFQPLRQVAAFVPFETSGSLVLAYCELTGADPFVVTRLDRLLKHRPRHLPFFLLLALWTIAGDFVVQLPCWLLRRTGAQAMIAVKRSGAP